MKAVVTVTAEELSILEQGLSVPPNDAVCDLALRLVDKLKGRAVEPMTQQQAQAFMRTLAAPMALRALETGNAILRDQVAYLEAQVRRQRGNA